MIDIVAARQMWEDLSKIEVGEVTPELMAMMCSVALVYLNELENLGYGADVEDVKQSHPAHLRLVE